jgi:glutaminase
MTTCGMYNGAGKFVKNLGIPSKSGVSGNLLSVVPGIGSIATWSPKLNPEGNTVKGIEMVRKIGELYNNFNLFHKSHNKKDLTWRAYHK